MNLSTLNEAELRDIRVETPDTPEQLVALIEQLVKREHDYGTCVYAMSMAAVAAYEYVARQLGVTGFQASCADMDIIRRNRRLDGPFMLVNGADALYPQYDIPEKVASFLRDIRPWLGEQAREKLAAKDGHAHPDVLNHWKALDIQNPKKETEA